jgi:heavy metal sensor kinase
MTLRRKLILLYSSLLAVLIITFGVVVFIVIRKTWIDALDSTLTDTSIQVITNSRTYLIPEFGSPTIGLRLAQLDVFRASGVFVQAWQVKPDSGSPQLLSASDNIASYEQALDQTSLKTGEPTFTNVTIQGTELRVLTWPVTLLGGQDSSLRIQVAASMRTVNEATGKLSIVILIGGALTIIMSGLLGTWLSNQAMKPIEAITQAADSIVTAKDLHIRLPWHGPMDELGRLTSVFNRMMDRLEHLFGVQQRLVQDVSHELRTPLTAIRGNIELIQRYGVDAESLEAIASETERMSRLVNDVLLLARADYGSMTLDMSEIDLDTVMTDVAREARVLVKDRDLSLRLSHIEPVRIKGNGDRLRQLLLNLVSNAIKFTPDDGAITLGLRQEDGQAVIQVADTGIGIEPDDLQRIFDRFYQADTSRSRIHTGEGAGLGLAIAKWIVEAHGGTISVDSEVGKGTTFTVRLPVLDTTPQSENGASSGYSPFHLRGIPTLFRRGAAEDEREAEETVPDPSGD